MKANMRQQDSSLYELFQGWYAHPSGGLFLKKTGTLIVADLHLGYSLTLRRKRGELGPPVDGETTRRLLALTEVFRPKELVLLGDVVHSGRLGPLEAKLLDQLLLTLCQRVPQVVLILGNHDHGLKIESASSVRLQRAWENEQAVAIHGHCPQKVTTRRLILGHLHPVFSIRDAAGVTHRLPAFVWGSQTLILPAFSPFATGHDLRKGLPQDWLAYFPAGDEIRLLLSTGKKLHCLQPTPISSGGYGSSSW